MKMKIVKYLSGAVGACAVGIVLMVGATKVVYPAISQLVGLSVAQSATLWNNVADAAKGDGLTSGILAEAPMLWNGLSFDRARGSIANGQQVDVTRIAGTLTPSDAFANPTTVNNMWTLNSLFNGTTWDRIRSATADALASTGITASGLVGWNGAAFDRIRTISAANNTAATSLGSSYVTQLSTWSITNTQASGSQATVSKAAGGGTVRHVATSISACLSGTAVQAPLVVNLRDGATGAGTVLRSWVLGIATINDAHCIDPSGLNITGSANTAMTIEFAGAGAATSTATVNLSGYNTP